VVKLRFGATAMQEAGEPKVEKGVEPLDEVPDRTDQEIFDAYKSNTFCNFRMLAPARLGRTAEAAEGALADDEERPNFGFGQTFGMTGPSVFETCQMPPGFDRQEWWSGKIVSLFNDMNIIVAITRDFCNCDSCPQMVAGKMIKANMWQYSYKCNFGQPRGQAIDLPAITYMENTLVYTERMLDDENVCPTDLLPGEDSVRYPPEFDQFIKTSVKRMFRCYAHIYHFHFKEFEKAKTDKNLNGLCKHLVIFCKLFDLLDPREYEPLQDLVTLFWDQHHGGRSTEELRRADH